MGYLALAQATIGPLVVAARCLLFALFAHIPFRPGKAARVNTKNSAALVALVAGRAAPLVAKSHIAAGVRSTRIKEILRFASPTIDPAPSTMWLLEPQQPETARLQFEREFSVSAQFVHKGHLHRQRIPASGIENPLFSGDNFEFLSYMRTPVDYQQMRSIHPVAKEAKFQMSGSAGIERIVCIPDDFDASQKIITADTGQIVPFAPADRAMKI